MSDLIKFLQTYEIPIYIILGFVGILYIRKMVRSWHEWRSAMFGLEKEISQRRFTSALVVVVLVLLVGVVELALVSFVAPSFSTVDSLSTPTLDLFTTPGNSGEIMETPGQSTSVAEIPVSEGCVPGQVEWTFPANGEEVSGLVELRGTVNIPNLGFYKFEFGQPGSDSWIAIAAGNSAVVDQPLGGNWNTEQLVPGDYSLRLVVYDSQNNILPACTITVRVTATEE